MLNALMKISKADGESRLVEFPNWIEVQSWDWEVEAETSWTKGGGASVGKPNPGKMNWEHYFDKSSPVILRYICSGAMFDTVELKMFKGTGQQTQTSVTSHFFNMLMEGVFITKVNQSATEEGNILQKVEMVFKKVTLNYKPQDDRKGSTAAPIGVIWDIPGGKVD